ncbi:N-acyl amino acid synthase FeeM domain-containing protein [Plectonema radiosum]|uniref:N-acyl amino acid synthase FeeM domain-containing protein n=1 Tax=Plectonema radiosum TaxID=945768 RepID=UPI0021E7510E|nr:GNAT family N-acyltransferase [Plectonema radiosum]
MKILENPQKITKKLSESLSCVIASTSNDFEQINRLWHEVYVKEMGWLQTTSQDLFHDRYHPYSVYFLASIDEVAVGTLRLVFDSSIGLPVEQFFHLGLLKINHRFVEGQRMMVSSSFRHRKFKSAPFGLLMSLNKAAFHYCFMSGVTHILADAFVNTPTTPIKAFKALGFEEVGCPFADTELSDSSKSVMLILGMDRLISKAYIAQGKLFKYLLEFDPNFHFYNNEFVIK